MEDIADTLNAKMSSPLRWKTSIEDEYLTVKIHYKIGFIDYIFCSLCDRTEKRSERTPVVPRAAAYYSLQH